MLAKVGDSLWKRMVADVWWRRCIMWMMYDVDDGWCGWWMMRTMAGFDDGWCGRKVMWMTDDVNEG